jgi:WhiB family redox-sensing transcriptional regulator
MLGFVASSRYGLSVDPFEPCIERPPEWHKLASCRDVEPEIFFPERGDSTKAARQVCARCPVARQCLEHAVSFPEHSGVWGATVEPERQKIRAQRKRRAA